MKSVQELCIQFWLPHYQKIVARFESVQKTTEEEFQGSVKYYLKGKAKIIWD